MSNPNPSWRPDQPFRFMDLPPELRTMVYERIPREVKIVAIHSSSDNIPLAFVRPVLSTAILATSKAVHHEAGPVVASILRKFILEKPPRIIGTSGVESMLILNEIVSDIVKFVKSLERGRVLSDRQLESLRPMDPSRARADMDIKFFIALSVVQLLYQRVTSSAAIQTFEYIYAYDKEDHYGTLSPADRVTARIPHVPSWYDDTRHMINLALVGQFPMKGRGVLDLLKTIKYDSLEPPSLLLCEESGHWYVPPTLLSREAWDTEWVAEQRDFDHGKGFDESLYSGLKRALYYRPGRPLAKRNLREESTVVRPVGDGREERSY